jgi:peroxiredoxin
MPIATGSIAPEFTLKSKRGEVISDIALADYRGKQNVVLLFFPFAFTGVCEKEMCSMTDALSKYNSLNAAIVGISVDSIFAQDAWATQHNIQVPLASDLNKATAAAYGVLLADIAGFGSASARAAFVVDKNGIVQYAEQTPTPLELPNFEAIEAKLAELQ